MTDEEVNELFKKSKHKTRFRSIMIASVIIVPVFIFTIIASCEHERQPAPIENFISEFGKPDSIYSSENELPPPQIITQILFYKKEHLNVAYYLTDDGWKLLGFLDTRTQKTLKLKEALRRLKKTSKLR